MLNYKFLLVLVVQISVLKADIFPKRFTYHSPDDANRTSSLKWDTIDMPVDHFITIKGDLKWNLETSNLRWLTIKQALADLADFIKDRKANIPGLENSKVVVVGGSYAGNLAAYMRLKYPKLVDAALASSAVPKIKVNNYEFLEIVQRHLLNNKLCLNTIIDGLKKAKSLIETQHCAMKISKDFNLCERLQYFDNKEKRNFFISISGIIGDMVQYSEKHGDKSLEKMCTDLLNNSDKEDAYTRLYKFIRNNYRYAFRKECMPTYKQTIADYRQTKITAERAWTYQTCSSVGLFITTDSPMKPFLSTTPIEYWYKLCNDIFGPGFNPASINNNVCKTRLEYFAPIRNITKTVFTVGTIDPWSGVGLDANLNDKAPVLVIKGASHCQDLKPRHESDSQYLMEAREKIKEYIYSWIQNV